MSFASYTSFGTSLAGWLLDTNTATITDVGVTQVADLITVGESRIFREARSRDMETSFGSTIASGVIALPTGYLDLKSAYVNTSPTVRLERRSEEWLNINYPSTITGIPQFIGRQGSNFIFGPYPDSNYTINGIYYQTPTAISGAAVNTLFTNNPDLYLFACLAEAEIIIGRDARVQLWEAKYNKILSLVNGTDQRENASGSSLQTRTRTNQSFRAA